MIIINRRIFSKECALNTGLTQQQVNKVLDYYISNMKANLIDGNEASIPGIGKIIPIERKINGHTDPITNQYHEGNTFKTIRIKVSPAFKETLNAY